MKINIVFCWEPRIASRAAAGESSEIMLKAIGAVVKQKRVDRVNEFVSSEANPRAKSKIKQEIA